MISNRIDARGRTLIINTAVAAHSLSKVKHVVIDTGDVPLVGARRVFVSGALLQAQNRVFVILTGMMGETLMHRHVYNHILVVCVARTGDSELGAGPVGESCVPNVSTNC